MENSTIFDDVLRTFQERRPQLLIPLINEVFHECYSDDTEITRLPEEYQQVISKIVADSCNKLDNKIYHFECQSRKDGNMILRMVEYDFMIALVDATGRNDTGQIHFPRSCVIYLRSTLTMPDEEQLEIIMPDGQVILYHIPLLKLKEYSIDEIFEKNLLILLPYYIINYEKKLSNIEKDVEKAASLLSEYESITARLEYTTRNDTTGLFQDIVQMMQKLIYYLLRKQPKLKERMGDIMGGKVLPLPSDKLREEREAGITLGLNQGIAQGISQGITQGISQSIRALIETCQEFQASKEDTVLRIMNKFSLSPEEATSLVEKYW